MDSPLSLKRLNCLKPLWSLDTERPHFRGKRVQTLDFNDGDYDDADEDDSDDFDLKVRQVRCGIFVVITNAQNLQELLGQTMVVNDRRRLPLLQISSGV